jgi:menaquinone-9 beta-reductase
MSLNLPFDQLPKQCDVLVIGAGPAGSAAAQIMARSGLDVVLIDQHAFPRDKICGDGLIPDAHHALERLGLLEEVMVHAQVVHEVTCIGPQGGRIGVPGQLAVLPRKQLDLILCRAAVAAGARMFAPARFTAPIEENRLGQVEVVGAVLQNMTAPHNESFCSVRARWVLLATGAVPQALQAAGQCERRTPSGVALRGYVRHPELSKTLHTLEVVWHPQIRPGYGWIFPAPNDIFNVGVGVGHSHSGRTKNQQNMSKINLRQMLQDFGKIYPPAARLLKEGEWLGEPKGAPLRCSLAGAGWSRAGLLVTGEAAGCTYSFTGEGIGKALETGMLAGQVLINQHRSGERSELVCQQYDSLLRRLQPRYDIYDKAHVVNHYPWLVDLIVWSAKRSPKRIQRMSGILAETHSPSSLRSPSTWWRLAFERG